MSRRRWDPRDHPRWPGRVSGEKGGQFRDATPGAGSWIASLSGRLAAGTAYSPQRAAAPPDLETWAARAAAQTQTGPRPSYRVSADTRTLVDRVAARLPQGEDGWVDLELYSEDGEHGLGGTRAPSAQLDAHLTDVLEAGRAIHRDFQIAADQDPEIRRLRELMRPGGDLSDQAMIQAPDSATRLRILRQRHASTRAIARRESEILRDLMASIRDHGNAHHIKARPIEWPGQTGGQAYRPPREGWADRLRHAEGFYPDAWVRASSRVPIHVADTDRGFYQHFNRILAVDAEPEAAERIYDGGLPSLEDETWVHELGHRMEQRVPGLRELEYAYVVRRARGSDGAIERPITMRRALPGSGYGPDEITYRDRWAQPYAGKTYEHGEGTRTVAQRTSIVDHEPAVRPWEVFQVGMQDTFGRSRHRFDSTSELQWFVLGALATLGEED